MCQRRGKERRDAGEGWRCGRGVQESWRLGDGVRVREGWGKVEVRLRATGLSDHSEAWAEARRDGEKRV